MSISPGSPPGMSGGPEPRGAPRPLLRRSMRRRNPYGGALFSWPAPGSTVLRRNLPSCCFHVIDASYPAPAKRVWRSVAAWEFGRDVTYPFECMKHLIRLSRPTLSDIAFERLTGNCYGTLSGAWRRDRGERHRGPFRRRHRSSSDNNKQRRRRVPSHAAQTRAVEGALRAANVSKTRTKGFALGGGALPVTRKSLGALRRIKA